MCMLIPPHKYERLTLKLMSVPFKKIKNNIYDMFNALNEAHLRRFATEFYIDLLNGFCLTLNRLHIFCLNAANLNNLILTNFVC